MTGCVVDDVAVCTCLIVVAVASATATPKAIESATKTNFGPILRPPGPSFTGPRYRQLGRLVKSPLNPGLVLFVRRPYAQIAAGHLVPPLIAVGVAAARRRGAATTSAWLHRASRGRRRPRRGRTRGRITGYGAPAARSAALRIRQADCKYKSGCNYCCQFHSGSSSIDHDNVGQNCWFYAKLQSAPMNSRTANFFRIEWNQAQRGELSRFRRVWSGSIPQGC